MPEFVELIQKIEYITLEQFIPNWTEIIKEMDEKNIKDERIEYCDVNGLEYWNHKSCLVGEAHHNNREYANNYGTIGCLTCNSFSLCPASSALKKGKETFQNFKLELFTHMLEVHTELMIRHG